MAKQNKLLVTLYWMMNHLVHQWTIHRIVLIESNNDESDKNHIICYWNDEYYETHKEELYPRYISFLSITATEIKIYLKGESYGQDKRH